MKLVKITKESRIPLIGSLNLGIIDRGTNLLQVRCTTVCNMKCPFCSTSANDLELHPTNFILDINYLLEEVEKVVKNKENVIIFLDSVGEPMTHPDFIYLVKGLKEIEKVKEIIVITNGTYLTKEKVDKLEKAGLDKINLSFHATDPELAKKLFGMPVYDVNKIIEMIKYIPSTKIKLTLTPVWLSKVNDHEIEKIIQLAKKVGCNVAIQNYEIHRYGRKMKGVKRESYYKFYNKLKELEKKHSIKLVYNPKDMRIEYSKRLEKPIQIGEKINTKVIEEGWFKNQKIVKHKNRVVTVKNCNAKKEDRINIRVTRNKDNIYLSERL